MSGVPGKNSSSVKRYLSIHPKNVHLNVIFTVNTKSKDNHFSTCTTLKTLLTVCPEESGRGFVMAGEVQLAPWPRSRFYGCPSAPSLLVKLQQPLLPLSFLLCVRGSGEAAMQVSMPPYQPRGAGAQNLTWQPGRCRDILHTACPCKQCGTGQEEGGLLEGQNSYRLWASREFNP